MPQLNRDILLEIFHELIKIDGFKNIDKFMLAGREPFNLVLDFCQNANSIVILKNEIIVEIPGINYDIIEDEEEDSDGVIHERLITGIPIPTLKTALIKPISIALASNLTFLEIKYFIPAFIPMLKAVDYEIKEVKIYDTNKKLKDIPEVCCNIPNVQNGVTIRFSSYFDNDQDGGDRNFGMASFAIPCRKLTLKNVYFNTISDDMFLSNPHLRAVRDLTIHGTFHKTGTFYAGLKRFAAFLLSTFPNLEILNVKFVFNNFSDFWYWNVYNMADIFQQLPRRIKGCICFKIFTPGRNVQIDHDKFCNVRKNSNEYYKIFPVTNTLSFKLVHEF